MCNEQTSLPQIIGCIDTKVKTQLCLHCRLADSSGGPIEVEQRGTFSTTYRRSAVDRHLSCQERYL